MLTASAYFSASRPDELPPDEEYEFYKGIRTSSGTTKTTAAGRLAAVDRLFFATLAELVVTPGTVMDIGVSSGATTAEWLAEFEKRGFDVEMTATDLAMRVYIHQINRHLRALVESSGHILQLEVVRLPVRTYTRRRDSFTGGVIWRRLLCAYARARLPSSERAGPYYFVVPQLRNQSRVKLCDDDIFAPNPREWVHASDVVRVANLLHTEYFSSQRISQAVETVRERCRGEGSLVIVCRGEGDAAEASIFRMGADRQFTVVSRLGRGSDVEALFTVASLPA